MAALTLTEGTTIKFNELTDFIAVGKGRFTGFCTVDPLDPRAPELLRKRVKEEGYAGLKLYPPTQCFLPSDMAVYPLYEEAEALSIPIMFHGYLHFPVVSQAR